MLGHDLEAAIVADDLTGALDMAAPFASRGFATRLLLDHAQEVSNVGTQVLTLTSASRGLPAQAAAENIRAAMRAALVSKPRILISKIDSMLRGDVANAIWAALQVSGRRHGLVVTAVPSHGRVMRHGEVFINGVSLRDNPLSFDDLSHSVPLPELLRTSCGEMSVHSWQRGHSTALSAAVGLHAYVADCETGDDLDRLAHFALRHADDLLIVGASGLGTAIAKQLASESSPTVHLPQRKGQGRNAAILFVIGSRTPTSAEQVNRLLEQGAQEIAVQLPFVEQTASALNREVQSGMLVVRPHGSLPFSRGSSEDIAGALGRTAAQLVQRLKIDAVVMSGGDTALAVFQALGVTQGNLLGELSPGTAIGTFPLDGALLTFVTKSGSFGNSDALVEISQSLQ